VADSVLFLPSDDILPCSFTHDKGNVAAMTDVAGWRPSVEMMPTDGDLQCCLTGPAVILGFTRDAIIAWYMLSSCVHLSNISRVFN